MPFFSKSMSRPPHCPVNIPKGSVVLILNSAVYWKGVVDIGTLIHTLSQSTSASQVGSLSCNMIILVVGVLLAPQKLNDTIPSITMRLYESYFVTLEHQ